MENDITKIIHDLNERKKESSCLYKISNILNESDDSIENILSKIVAILPLGYQFSEICAAQITFNGRSFTSDNFKITELKQSAKIRVEDAEIGVVSVYYTKPIKSEKNRIFLSEEQLMLNEVADKIRQHITILQFREMIDGTKELSKKLDIPLELVKWLLQWHIKENEIYDLLTSRVNFKKNELIIKQDTLATYLLLLTDGLAKVFVEDFKNRTYTIRLIRPFDFIGLSSVFSNGNYGYSASTVLPSSGFVVPKEKLKLIIDKNSKFNFRLIKWYGDNLNFSFHKLNFLANKQTLGRLADILLYLYRDIFDKNIIENSITRKILADLAGMSTENAVRVLSEFKKDGIIDLKREGIEILKPDLLETFSLVG